MLKVLGDRPQRKGREEAQGSAEHDGSENQHAEGRRIAGQRALRDRQTALGCEPSRQGQRHAANPYRPASMAAVVVML